MNKNFIQNIMLLAAILASVAAKAEVRSFNADTKNYGELETLLGDNWNQIDSLVVSGPINSVDFETIRKCGVYGELEVVNLKNADIMDKKIPDGAFWDANQIKDDNKVELSNIEKIMLPDDIVEIGSTAFSFLRLRELELPKSVKTLGISCFSHIDFSKMGEFTLPEGIEVIPTHCFYHIYNLNKLTLPSTTKSIAMFGFEYAEVKEVVFPEGLESIGEFAFIHSGLERAILPDSCTDLGEGVFSTCKQLKELVLPTGLNMVPKNFAEICTALESVIIPESTIGIGDQAFIECQSLKSVYLPYSLNGINELAFYGCKSLESLYFRRDLTYIGYDAFTGCSGLKSIYINTYFVPFCGNDINGKPGMRYGVPPEQFFKNIDLSIPVYVPFGKKELYSQSYGWRDFTNYIETDTFPEDLESVALTNAEKFSLSTTNGILTIHLGDATQRNFSIYSMDGQRIAGGVANHGDTNVELPSGVYVVKLGSKSMKIVI